MNTHLGSMMAVPDVRSEFRLAFHTQAELSAAYMPLFKDGGLFIPTTQPHGLGDRVVLTLKLPGEAQSWKVCGNVVWITPAHAQGGRPPGIGISLGSDDSSRLLQRHLEDLLGNSWDAERLTPIY